MDRASKRLVDLSKEESLALIQESKSALQWFPDNKLWKWHQDVPQLEIVVTDAGEAAAKKILAEDGWPVDLA